VTIVKKTKSKRLMSIDPSINNLGVAVWDIEPIKLLMHRLIHPTVVSRVNSFEKAWSMLEQMKQWKTTYGVTNIIVEQPEVWNVAGFEARETGSMDKLNFVCGLLYSLRSEVEEYRLVTPQQWKGQLKKEIMCNRLYNHYIVQNIDLRKIDANVADGIGIGHFYLYGRV
jgi:hypothetical protein